MNGDQNSNGIRAIYDACFNLYPDQPTPPQVTALQKFWLGGPDPLDYISMYDSLGYTSTESDKTSSSAHWHYITYGLSDLYGDSRLHDLNLNNNGPSGFGFELTFRLKRGTEMKAPLWPAMVLQSLARYLFRSQAKFAPGDHIPWGKSLEDVGAKESETGFELSDSRISNMLIAADPQLDRIETKHGWVDFLQIVGASDDEVTLARRGSGLATLEGLSSHSDTGGWLLVTDMRRGETLESLMAASSLSNSGLTGSTMSGVTTEVAWLSLDEEDGDEENDDIVDVVGDDSIRRIFDTDSELEADQLLSNGTVATTSSPFYGAPGPTSMSPSSLELFPPRHLTGVMHLRISREAAEVMQHVLTDRLRLGRHFTLLHCRSDVAVTLVSTGVGGAFVSESRPFGCRGSWLQIFVNSDWLDELEFKFADLVKIEKSMLPIVLRFPSQRAIISIHLSEDVDPA